MIEFIFLQPPIPFHWHLFRILFSYDLNTFLSVLVQTCNILIYYYKIYQVKFPVSFSDFFQVQLPTDFQFHGFRSYRLLALLSQSIVFPLSISQHFSSNFRALISLIFQFSELYCFPFSFGRLKTNKNMFFFSPWTRLSERATRERESSFFILN